MAAEFNIEQRWPDLFAPLDDAQRRAVTQSLAASWHEGWEPNRDDVAFLIDAVVNKPDEATFLRRLHEHATGATAHAAR